jgi:hypothetical protein
MLIVTVIFGNGAYHTDYVGLLHRDQSEVTFKTEAECLDQVDAVARRARAPEWQPGRKTKAMPLAGICLPGSLADFVRSSAKPRVAAEKVREFSLPEGVLTDYQPPRPAGQPSPQQPPLNLQPPPPTAPKTR